MTSLHQKLNQLSLTTMSRQLDQTISEATAKNLSLTQARESLLDLELESRNRRSIERRFRLSRLHAQHSIDSFHFKHHKSRMELKNRILRLLDLDFLARQFKVTGGIIHNAALGAAFRAADEGGPVTMERVAFALKREFQKLGRLRTESEFERYYGLVNGVDDVAPAR